MEKYFPFSSLSFSLDGSKIFFLNTKKRKKRKIKRRQRCEWEKSISSAVSTHTDFSSVCCILNGKIMCECIGGNYLTMEGKMLDESSKAISFSFFLCRFHLWIIFGCRISFLYHLTSTTTTSFYNSAWIIHSLLFHPAFYKYRSNNKEKCRQCTCTFISLIFNKK